MKTPTSLFQHNLQQSNLVFQAHGAMTVEDFISFASEYLHEGCEGLYENIAQCQSEINMFGDSGPGSLFRLREQIQEFNKIADRFTALTGYIVGRPRMPYHP